MRAGRLTGTIRSLKPSFGFITTTIDGETVDFFFLPSALEKVDNATFSDLALGQTVEFTGIEHPKGRRAIEIRVRTPR